MKPAASLVRVLQPPLPNRVMLAVVIFATSFGCTNLPEVQQGICGNLVLEAGEDCDSAGDNCVPPQEPDQCHYSCAVELCPAGFGCGVDDVCRKHSGSFLADRTPVSIGGRGLESGNFDEDGRLDLLVSDDTSYTVLFDSAGKVQAFTPVPKAEKVFALADVNGDERTDYIWDTDLRVLALSVAYADASGALIPAPNVTALPPARAYRMFAAVSEEARDGELYLIADHTVYRFPDYSGKRPELGFTRAFELEAELSPNDQTPRIPGPIATGRFNRTISSPCAEIAVPINPPAVISDTTQYKVPEVVIYSPCSSPRLELSRVRFPTGGPLRPIRRILVGDVQGDGLPDLIMPDEEFPDVVNFAYGVGDGTFHSSRLVPKEKGDGRLDLNPLVFDEERHLIFAGNLNDDRIVDLFVEGSVMLSAPQQGPASAECSPIDGYRCALDCALFQCSWFDTWVQFADYTGDSIPDIVLPTGDSSDLAFWMGTKDERYRAFRLRSFGVVNGNWDFTQAAQQAASADFDGDQIMDFAFPLRESRDSKTGSISMFYGKAFAPPEQSFNTGELGNPLETAATPVLSTKGPSAILGVLSEFPEGVRATVYVGQDDRKPISPILVPGGFVPPGADVPLTLQLLAGNFRGQGQDFVVITEGENFEAQRQLKTVLRDGPGYRMPSDEDKGVPFPDSFKFKHWRTFVLDVDDDTKDELVFLGISEDMQNAQLLLAEFQDGGWQFAPQRALADSSTDTEFLVRPIVMQNADIDLDGRNDVYGMATINGKPTLAVYLSSVGEPLSNESLRLLKAPSASFAYTWINVDEDPTPEFVLCATDQIQIYDVDLNDDELHLKGAPLSGPAHTQSVRSGDFNGDGVNDLAVLGGLEEERYSGDSVEIIWGIPLR